MNSQKLTISAQTLPNEHTHIFVFPIEGSGNANVVFCNMILHFWYRYYSTMVYYKRIYSTSINLA